MSLIDDLRADVPAPELDRREVLGKITGLALSVAGIGTVFTTLKFMKPNVLFEPPTRFRVGRPEEIPLGTLAVLSEQKLFLGHAREGFFAMSSICTHLGCMTRYLPSEGVIACPCHGSRFDQTGKVVGGPAPLPLRRYYLALSDGELLVDMMRPVDHGFVLRA